MSDSFSELWNSIEPSKQISRPSTPLVASKAQSYAAASSDVFSTLASSSRSLTPSLQPQRPQSSQRSLSRGTNDDAFGSLLSSSFSSTGKSGNLTLAERQAAAAKEQQEKLEREKVKKAKEAAAWSGLDLLSQRNAKLPDTETAFTDRSDWIFNQPLRKSTSNAPSAAFDDDWGLSSSQSTTQPVAQPRPSMTTSSSLLDILDDDLLSGLSPSNGRSLLNGHNDKQTSTPGNGSDVRSSRLSMKADSPGNFDFGDREDKLLDDSGESGGEDGGGDDVLGILGKPVDSISKQKLSTPHTPQAPEAISTRTANSPPPHIVGRIVEMGFSPDQARLALAATDSGVDVQQALEMLLANGAGADGRDDESPGRVEARPKDRDDEFGIQRSSTSINRAKVETGRFPVHRQLSAAARNQTPTQASTSFLSGDLQERADKVLTQASEFGVSVFNRANAFWKQGKERVQKAYEEHAASSQGGSKGRVPDDGRPRWLIDAHAARGEAGSDGHESELIRDSKYREEEFRDEIDAKALEHQVDGLKLQSIVPNNASTSMSGPRIKNLSSDEPVPYVSPARRRGTTRIPQAVPTQLLSSPSPAIRVPSPITQRVRDAVSASPSVIALSNKHRVVGTELFKLGQYAEAENAYTSALDSLPPNHLLLVPLYNNRAVTRLKIGDHSGAIEDCTTVLSIIGSSYHPAKEAKVTKEEEGSSVDLADAVLKAYRRRAEAFEGKEKWAMAQKDWEAIIGCEWGMRARSDALNGLSRCKKMVSPEREPETAANLKPRTIQPARRSSQQTFEAVQKLREANKALEEEDQQKLDLKDSVDARIVAWRGGKETNLRALLASLESVLWPELGWQKVGMHELVTPGQVKVRYTKAIAKLHPDKLNTNNTTLEQRMIANAVFATLNNAWLVFKQ